MKVIRIPIIHTFEIVKIVDHVAEGNQQVQDLDVENWDNQQVEPNSVDNLAVLEVDHMEAFQDTEVEDTVDLEADNQDNGHAVDIHLCMVEGQGH